MGFRAAPSSFPLLAVALTVMVVALPARADLTADVETLTAAYERGAAVVTRLPPQFLIAGERRRVTFAAQLTKAGKARCRTLIVIAERPLAFELRPALPGGLGLRSEPIESAAGHATIVDCGRGTLAVGAIDIVMGARRGAVELLLVSHAKVLTSPEVVLPQRAIGPVAPHGEVAGALKLAPLEERVTRAEVSARADGAQLVVRVPTVSDDRGTNALALRLREGCHRFNVLAEQRVLPQRASGAGPTLQGVDIDAEVRDPTRDVPLRQDRSHAPDARLDFCVGDTMRVDLRFAGAGGRTRVMVLDAHWPIPEGVPKGWGSRARAGHAWALHRRRMPAVGHAPLLSTIGAPGVTHIPMTVQPGACYAASVAISEGRANAGQLRVRVGAELRHDDMSELPRAAAVSFCAGPHDRTAQLHVDVRADNAWWLLHAWQLTGPPRRSSEGGP